MKKKVCKVQFDHSLSSLLDGFVCQVINAIGGRVRVTRSIGRPDELLYWGDDIIEMQVQMAVDEHLACLYERYVRETENYIDECKLALKNIEDAYARIKLMSPEEIEYEETYGGQKRCTLQIKLNRQLPEIKEMVQESAA